MRINLRKFSGVTVVATLLLLCADAAFAYKSYDISVFKDVLEHDPILMGLFLLDVLIIAYRLHKIYRSMFTVWYFSLSALFQELMIILVAASAILCIGPVALEAADLLDSKALYIYLGVVLFLFCRPKSKKQKEQPDNQNQDKQKTKSKTSIFTILIIAASAYYGYQKISGNNVAACTEQPRIETQRAKTDSHKNKEKSLNGTKTAEQKKIEQVRREVKKNSEVDEILKGVENGEADAQFRLGLMYKQGQNVKKDDEQAAYWFKKSYEQGNAEAQFLLALAYADGYGVEKNEAQAFKLMKEITEKKPSSIKNFYVFEANFTPILSAEGLVGAAQVWVGVAYFNGSGVQKNVLQAEYWLKKGEKLIRLSAEKVKKYAADVAKRAENGDDDAQLQLALTQDKRINF